MNDTIDTKEIRSRLSDKITTHFDGCWQYHPECLIVKLCNEIDNLRTLRTALLTHRDLLLTKVNELETRLKELQS